MKQLPGAFASRRRDVLEVEPAGELQHAWSARRRCAEAGDVAERAAANGRVRVGQNRVIEYVERLEANLESRLLIYVECAEDAGVDVGLSGPAERVAGKIAEGRRSNLRGRLEFVVGGLHGVGEGLWIEPCLAAGNSGVVRSPVVAAQLV